MEKITREATIWVDEVPSKFSELNRQLFHISYGIIILVATLLFSKNIIATILGAFVVFGGTLSLIVKGGKARFMLKILDYFDRPDDFETFPGKGAFFFTFGCAMTLFIFEKNIALASIAILTFGDSISHLFGAYIKKYKYSSEDKSKVIEGLFAGIIAASVAGAFFVEPFFAMIASVITMIIEFIEFKVVKLDDNFYIPLIAGAILFVLTNYVM